MKISKTNLFYKWACIPHRIDKWMSPDSKSDYIPKTTCKMLQHMFLTTPAYFLLLTVCGALTIVCSPMLYMDDLEQKWKKQPPAWYTRLNARWMRSWIHRKGSKIKSLVCKPIELK